MRELTYSLCKPQIVTDVRTLSAFLAVEQSAGGINCWKCGQRFRGIEVSIRMKYLRNDLLPFLGYPKDALDFIQPNIRYHNLSSELRGILSKIEFLMNKDNDAGTAKGTLSGISGCIF